MIHTFSESRKSITCGFYFYVAFFLFFSFSVSIGVLVVLSLAVMTVGAYFASVNDLEFNFLGYFWMSTNCLFTAGKLPLFYYFMMIYYQSFLFFKQDMCCIWDMPALISNWLSLAWFFIIIYCARFCYCPCAYISTKSPPLFQALRFSIHRLLRWM